MQRSPSVAPVASADRTFIELAKLLRTAQMTSGNFAPIDPALEARVACLLDWLNGQGPLPAFRKVEAELQLRKLLAARLRMSADRRRLPGIAEEQIKRPIFVIGFGRTGTTLIHSLLAEDVGARAPLWWHTHEPSPPPGEIPVVTERIESAGREVDELLRIAPGLLPLHPYWDKRGLCPIEDEEVLALDFHTAYPSLLYKVPTLALNIEAADPALAYAFHRQFLQHLQWNTGQGHWVTKGIYHQFVLDDLFAAYPDALCIWPHREPAQIWPSILAITAVLYGGITGWAMDMATLGPVFVESIAQSLMAVVANPLVDDPRIVHVQFEDVVKDPVQTIKQAYRHWEMPFSATFEAKMRAWLAAPANRADRYGRYHYALEPFGLTADMLEAPFEPYRERFGLRRQEFTA